jgi:LuxR family maltose regulon positive regulatory protein
MLLQTRIIYLQGHNLYGLAMVDCIDALCDYLLGDLTLAAEKVYTSRAERGIS